MAGIIVYNINNETHNGYSSFFIGRGSILGNPYTDKPLNKTMAVYKAKTREEAIKRYESYFDIMYSGNKNFKDLIDTIYTLYKAGDTVYLGCYCKPLPCHGDVIKAKLEQRLLKEKLDEIRKNKKK